MIHMREFTLPRPGRLGNLLVGFDLEWTKNYRVKNGNRPFCFSFVYVVDSPDGSAQHRFGLDARYVETKKEIHNLVREVERLLSELRGMGKRVLLIGHQLSSDLGVLLQTAGRPVPMISSLRAAWHARKGPAASQQPFRVFDTRYDMDSFFRERSRRLVDVCGECNLDVTQPELGNGSMTKMQRRYFETGNKDLMERLMTLNIRHSLSAVLVYLCGTRGAPSPHTVNVNDILRANLASQVGYVNGRDFQHLLS